MPGETDSRVNPGHLTDHGAAESDSLRRSASAAVPTRPTASESETGAHLRYDQDALENSAAEEASAVAAAQDQLPQRTAQPAVPRGARVRAKVIPLHWLLLPAPPLAETPRVRRRRELSLRLASHSLARRCPWRGHRLVPADDSRLLCAPSRPHFELPRCDLPESIEEIWPAPRRSRPATVIASDRASVPAIPVSPDIWRHTGLPTNLALRHPPVLGPGRQDVQIQTHFTPQPLLTPPQKLPSRLAQTIGNFLWEFTTDLIRYESRASNESYRYPVHRAITLGSLPAYHFLVTRTNHGDWYGRDRASSYVNALRVPE